MRGRMSSEIKKGLLECEIQSNGVLGVIHDIRGKVP